MPWLQVFLKAVGSFFLNPVLYIGILFAVYIGYQRVKQERKDFHIRVQDGLFELRTFIFKGILIGLIFSLINLLIGVSVPLAFIISASIITSLFAMTTKPSLLSPAYTLGLTFFLLMTVVEYELQVPVYREAFSSLDSMVIPGAALVTGILLLIEGIMIYWNASQNTSPKLALSKRGLKAGAHQSKRLWLIPLLFLVPEGVLNIPVDFWPIIPIGSENFSLILVPAVLGFGQEIHYTLPVKAVQTTGRRVIYLSILVYALAVGGYWYPLLSIIAVSIAIIGRLLIGWLQRSENRKHPFFFLKKEKGIVALDIIPGSPADRMGIQIGEVIKTVNGVPVQNEREYYLALQKNRAFCKLEVIDNNGENRFVQQALFEGEHHELGVILYDIENPWGQEVG